MAEKILSHGNIECYATPKCGISTAHYMVDKIIVPNITKPLKRKYVFIITRNPIERVSSFYIQKVISRQTILRKSQLCGPKTMEQDFKEIDFRNYSFIQFVRLLNTIPNECLERHLAPQHFGTKGIVFDRMVKLENFESDIREVFDDIGIGHIEEIPHLNDSSKKVLLCPDKKELPNYHRRRNVKTLGAFNLNRIELVDAGIPKDYKYFMNPEIKDILYKKYKEDFELINTE